MFSGWAAVLAVVLVIVLLVCAIVSERGSNWRSAEEANY